jgi:hypothetical protein
MIGQVVWKGTEQESFDLLKAIQRNCACEYAPTGARTRPCLPHQALVGDQRWLDGLLFGRRIADRLTAEEWGPRQRERLARWQSSAGEAGSGCG